MATTTHDIPMLITSTTASCERRITPFWTISQLKAKLEPVSGIPISSQQLTLVLPDRRNVVIEAKDEDAVQLSTFELIAYAEINVGERAVLLSVSTTCWDKLQFIGKPVQYDLLLYTFGSGRGVPSHEPVHQEVSKYFLTLSGPPLFIRSPYGSSYLPRVSPIFICHPNKVNPPPPHTTKWRFSFRYFAYCIIFIFINPTPWFLLI